MVKNPSGTSSSNCKRVAEGTDCRRNDKDDDEDDDDDDVDGVGGVILEDCCFVVTDGARKAWPTEER